MKIAKRSWARLRNHFEMAHKKPDSPLRAIDVVNGWIDQLGPVYEHVNRSRECARIEKLAAEYGFDEIPCRSALRFRWMQAQMRWKRLTGSSDQIVQDEYEKDTWETPAVGLSVDAAWNPKKQVLEYRGVWLHADIRSSMARNTHLGGTRP
jgi:hypothetical protein